MVKLHVLKFAATNCLKPLYIPVYSLCSCLIVYSSVFFTNIAFLNAYQVSYPGLVFSNVSRFCLNSYERGGGRMAAYLQHPTKQAGFSK